MDENLIREIHYLTRLIENHKKNSLDKLCCTERPVTNKLCCTERPVMNKLCCTERPVMNQNLCHNKTENYINLFHKSQQLPKTSNCTSHNELTSTNVYINPYFKHQSSAIHINPKLHAKPVVHVNPKMMKSVINSNENVQYSSSGNVINATGITSTANIKQNTVQKSVHVNPNLVKKLSSSVQSKSVENKEIAVQNITHSTCSRLKLVKSTNSPKVVHSQRKVNNSSIAILSRTKLVRVRRLSRKSLNTSQPEQCKIKKSPNMIIRHLKPSPQKIVKARIVNTLQHSDGKSINFVKSPAIKPKINKYRIDRTATKTANIKEHVCLDKKKTTNNKMELITIEGIVYKSSKNHLVRNSYGVKKKRGLNLKSDKFIVATNGKKLCRIRSIKQLPDNSCTKISSTMNTNKLISSTVQKVNYKNNISNKVKQKSIQILRNKMQKNNQPCLIFQKFGYCSGHQKGACVKRHDKKQISLCKKFLQGNCLLDKCLLSHDVGPEKMPTCKYFLEGCCTRDACPYRHIKVSSSTPICIAFLRGYCAQGSECKQRHENLCPEFEKTKNCSKGKHCPYPHKSQSSNKQHHLKSKYNRPTNQVTPLVTKDSSAINTENRLRYYEQANTLNKSLERKKESIMKKIKLMKRTNSLANSDTPTELSSNDTNSEVCTDSDGSECVSDPKVLKRPPIGVLPAYIPIG